MTISEGVLSGMSFRDRQMAGVSEKGSGQELTKADKVAACIKGDATIAEQILNAAEDVSGVGADKEDQLEAIRTELLELQQELRRVDKEILEVAGSDEERYRELSKKHYELMVGMRTKLEEIKDL